METAFIVKKILHLRLRNMRNFVVGIEPIWLENGFESDHKKHNFDNPGVRSRANWSSVDFRNVLVRDKRQKHNWYLRRSQYCPDFVRSFANLEMQRRLFRSENSIDL